MNSLPSYEELRRGSLSSETECLQYCLDIGMLRPFQSCEECNNFMTLKKCPTSKYTDGYCWQCSDTSSDIDHFCSVRTGSILHKRKLPFSVFLHIIWLFCNRLSVCDVARTITISAGCIRSIFSSIRNCMLEDLFDNGARRKIGGVGCIVEIDESKFGKRKYNRGRRVVGKWVLGGFCRTTGDCFLVECTGNRRDHNILITLIKEHVLPGTTILTDKWKGYNALQNHGFPHQVVNHSRGFVDPVTGVHTNSCEGMWFHAKNHMRRGTGRTRTNSAAMTVALSEFMWCKRYGLTRDSASVRKAFNQDIPALFRRIFD